MPRLGIKDWDRRSADEWQSLQLARCREFLGQQVLPFSPFYRRLFAEAGIDPRSIRSMDDLPARCLVSWRGEATLSPLPKSLRDSFFRPRRGLNTHHLGARVGEVYLQAKRAAKVGRSCQLEVAAVYSHRA